MELILSALFTDLKQTHDWPLRIGFFSGRNLTPHFSFRAFFALTATIVSRMAEKKRDSIMSITNNNNSVMIERVTESP